MKRKQFTGIGLIILFFVLGFCFTSSHEEQSASEEETNALITQNESPASKPVQSVLVYSAAYNVDLGGLESFHSFDAHKYQKIHQQLLDDKIVNPDAMLEPEEISEKDLLRIHTPEYLKSLLDPLKLRQYFETPVASLIPPNLIDQFVLKPFRTATGGTLLAARQALKQGMAINLGGGYHHAKPDKGEGFCIYADMPITVRVLQAEGKIKTALIIDLDAHQGNGTIVCLPEDESTYCLSLHQGNIYPVPKEQGDWDIELAAGTGDQEYLELLERTLNEVFDKAKQPDIVIYQAGCDTLRTDPLAGLNMTAEGIVQRDLMVIQACVKRNIPVVMTLGGGYSENAWKVQYESVKAILKKYPSSQTDQ